MRVSKVFAQNFRSIRTLTVELTGFDCFVGPNNSGKSNLFDVFSFLAETATRGLQQAIGRRDPGRLRHYAAPEKEPVIVEVSVDTPDSSTFRRLE